MRVTTKQLNKELGKEVVYSAGPKKWKVIKGAAVKIFNGNLKDVYNNIVDFYTDTTKGQEIFIPVNAARIMFDVALNIYDSIDVRQAWANAIEKVNDEKYKNQKEVFSTFYKLNISPYDYFGLMMRTIMNMGDDKDFEKVKNDITGENVKSKLKR